MIDSQPLQLNFRQYGDAGPPLIILHGLFGSLGNWGWHSKQLAENYSVYGVDLRNHGDSPHSAEMDYPSMAQDIAAFLQRQEIGPCSIVGHSMGGKVAMELALSDASLLSKLIVVDIAPVHYASAADGHLAVIEGMSKLNFDEIENRREAEIFLKGYIKDEDTRKFVLTNLVRDGEGGYRWRLNLDGISRNYDRLREKPGPGKAFEKPTLFIKGALSNYIQTEHQQETLESFPNASVKVIMETGHWVHAEKPQAVQKILKDFLAA